MALPPEPLDIRGVNPKKEPKVGQAERFFIDYETFKTEVDEKFENLEEEVEEAFERVRNDFNGILDRLRAAEWKIREIDTKDDPFPLQPTTAPEVRNSPVVTICYPDGTETVIPLSRSLSLLDSSSEGARDRWALISALNQEGVTRG